MNTKVLQVVDMGTRLIIIACLIWIGITVVQIKKISENLPTYYPETDFTAIDYTLSDMHRTLSDVDGSLDSIESDVSGIASDLTSIGSDVEDLTLR